MTSIETSSFSGMSADIANTSAFLPEEPSHVLHYVYITPDWHDNFIGWAQYISSFLETMGLTTQVGAGTAGGMPGTEMRYDSVIEVFAKPNFQILLTIPEGLPTEGEWQIHVEKDNVATEYDLADFAGERVNLDD